MLFIFSGTNFARNLLLNRTTDLSWDGVAHLPWHRPGHWHLDGAAGDILGRSGGGVAPGLAGGDAHLLGDVADNRVAVLSGDRDADLAGSGDADLARDLARYLEWDGMALSLGTGDAAGYRLGHR